MSRSNDPPSLVLHNQRPAEQTTWRRVNRKMDIALLPFLSLLYLFNGLDRSNIGNAETQGFSRAIGVSQDDFNLAISLFFVTFVLLQAPSAAIGRYLGANVWIPVMMIGWGISTIAHAFVKGRVALFAMRLMTGACEAGFYPSAVAYLSAFYCRYDMAIRLALFFGQYAVAGSLSGTIAYAVFHIRGHSLQNWQYLFVIEGSLTVLIAFCAWFWLPNGPGTAWFLNSEERVFAAARIAHENASTSSPDDANNDFETKGLTKRDVTETVKDWKTWYVLAFNICASVPSQAFSVFLPLVVEGLGYSSVEANLMTVPPYVCGALGLYLVAWSSDRHRERGYHIIGGITVTLVGLITCVLAPNNISRYAGLCILLFGSYISPPLTMIWLSGNTPEPGKRSLVLGVNGYGNLAGVIGSQLYKAKYAPTYRVPFYATLCFVAAALAGYTTYRHMLRVVNRRKQEIIKDKSASEILAERQDDTRYADRKWTFLYGL